VKNWKYIFYLQLIGVKSVQIALITSRKHA